MTESVRIALSLGSNIDRYRHINAGLDALEAEFGEVLCSPVYETAAVGFDGSPFLNLVAVIHSPLSLSDVNVALKRIEDANGRDRSGPKFSPRTLDIDVVTYGDALGVVEGVELPRPELFKNAFVTKPMADLLAEVPVPGQGCNYLQLWQQYGNRDQALQQVPFERR